MQANKTLIFFISFVLAIGTSCGSNSETTGDVQQTDSLSSLDESVPADNTDSGESSDSGLTGQDTDNLDDVLADVNQSNDSSTEEDAAQEEDVSTFSCMSEPDGTPCDDGDDTTIEDTCYSGVCTGVLSPLGWHYEFQGEVLGRFSKLRVKQAIGPDADESWTPWVETMNDWDNSYIISGEASEALPAYTVQIINDCSTSNNVDAFLNAQLWSWYSTEATVPKDGFLILKNDKGEEELRLDIFEVTWTSYAPEFGFCMSEENLELEATKLMIGTPQ